MRLTSIAGTALSIVSLLSGISNAQDDCDAPPDVAPFAPGTTGGEPFPNPPDGETSCECKWNSGDSIIGIEAWSAKFQVRAIRFKWATYGWSEIYGTKFTGEEVAWNHNQTTWDMGDEIGMLSSCSMWQND
jgi:hypothetical protein